uniref:Major facilitator superfamily (MFS) profile domain-containing protein n=1 Tax=Meloidogyne enterolobii TaxID=390850 RepID=A0A6V7XZT9_MELEN|nr:unnamed protein product [Meloidogyne enterolobii]
MSENLILGILIFALFLDLLAFTLILPLFPSILEHFSKLQQKIMFDPLFSTFSQLSGYIQSVLNVPSLDRYNNVFFGGILGSLFSFLQFLSSPIFGAFSDKYGRKPLLLFAVFGSLISYLFWSISGLSFLLFFFSRLIGGLSKASISLAIAIVTDLLPDERRGKGMALVGACFSLAFIAGPSIGACLSLHGRDNDQFNSRPAYLAITLTILEALILLIFLPETLKNNEKRKNKTSKQKYSLWTFINPFSTTNNSKKLEDIPSNKFLLNSISLIYFLFLLFFSALEFTLGFLTHIRFYYDSRQQGKLYLISGICMLLIQGVFVRRSPSTSKAQSKCALFGLIAIVPAYLFMAIANSEFLLYTGLLFYSISSATVVPSLTALFSRYCEQTQRGAFLGIFRSVGALSRAFGPLLGSTLFWMFGPTLSYSFGAICLLIPMFMFIKLRNKQK